MYDCSDLAADLVQRLTKAGFDVTRANPEEVKYALDQCLILPKATVMLQQAIANRRKRAAV